MYEKPETIYQNMEKVQCIINLGYDKQKKDIMLCKCTHIVPVIVGILVKFSKV